MLTLPDVVNGIWFPRGTIFPNDQVRDVEAVSGEIMRKERGVWLDEEPIIVTEKQKQEIITFVQETDNAKELVHKEEKSTKYKSEWKQSKKASGEL